MQATASPQLGPEISPRTLMMRRFRQEKIAVLGMVAIIIFVLLAVLAPVLAPYDPLAQNIQESLASPSPTHWLCPENTSVQIGVSNSASSGPSVWVTAARKSSALRGRYCTDRPVA